MVRISQSWHSDPRKGRAGEDMQLSELTVLCSGRDDLVWLCADDPPMMHGEDASGMWVGLSVEEAWALVDRLDAELPDRPCCAPPLGPASRPAQRHLRVVPEP
jgi:hypothetical protein